MKNTLHFTFLRTLLILAFGLFFNGAWGQVDEIIYQTGFESNDGFLAGTGYQGTTTGGSNDKTWTTYYGTASTSNPLISGNQSLQMRLYSNGNIGNCKMNFDLQKVTRITFKAKNDSNINLSVSYSTNGGATYINNEVFSVTSNNSDFTYDVSATGEFENIRIRFQVVGTPPGSSNKKISIDDVVVYGAIINSNTPTLSVGINSLSFPNTNTTEFSASQSFDVSGSNLTEGITVTAPSTDFQVSLNDVDWSNTVTVAQTGGIVTSATVYARFSPQSTGEKSGNITVVSADATTVNVAVSGIGTIPSPLATEGSSIGSANFTANWNLVNGVTNYRLDVSTNENFSTQGVGFSEGFNNEAFPPAGWENDNWSRSTGSGDINSGSGAAVGDAANGSLTTVAVSFPSLLSFFLGRSSNNSNKTLNVEVSITSQTSGFVNVATFNHSNVPNSSYNQYTVDLSEYNDKPVVYIRFVKVSSTTSPWRLDDVVVTPYFTPDFVTGYDNLLVNGNSQIVEGLDEGTEYFYRVRAENDNDISLNSNVINVTTISTSTTWSGSDWSNEVPTNTSDAIIAGDYNTATNGTFTAKSLAVNSGVFTVASGTSVTVENAVTSAGATNFIVESNANLIQTSSAANTGAITVERESALLVRLDHTLWSSPVDAQKLFAFSPNTLTNRFYTYATATNNYVNTGLSATTDFIVGKGYGVRAPNDHSTTPATWLGTFTGVPNNGDVSFTLTNVGEAFNLVGNPYPSVIDGAAFVAANSGRINGTLYFYAHTLTMNAQGAFPAGTNYALWNATGQTAATVGTSGVPALVPNGKIQVGQGFLVKSTNSSALVFNNTMREANTGNQFFRTASEVQATSEAEKHRLWLNLTNAEGTTFNQILVGYVAGATQEIDNLYDGLSFGNEGSALSSRLSNEDYTIQGRALPFSAADVVPLGFKAVTPGNYTISLSDRDGVFAADQNVFLKDNANGTINNIKTAPYTFTAQAGTFNNRFEVVYQATLGTPESTFNSSAVVAYVKEAQLNIQTKGNSMKAVSVYDVRGRLLFSKSEINAADFVAQGLAAQNQVLLVQVTAENGEVATVKVIF